MAEARKPEGGDPVLAIGRGKIDPVYCLCGTERYLADRCLTAVRAAVLGQGGVPGFNLDTFDLQESGIGPVLAAARTLPMMAKRRLVIARGVDQVKADQLEPLLEYLADPNPSTCLVLLGGKVDVRFRVFQSLRKAGWLHDFQPLRDRELPAWIAAEAKTRGAPIDADAAGALAEMAGPELARLAQAVEQLVLYAGERRRITLEDVENVVAETRQRGVFELTRAISEGDERRSLLILGNMLRGREPPLRILAMLVRQLRQIWRAKELMSSGVPRQELASALGVPPFFLDEVLGPARRMDGAVLAQGFERLYRADRALKSSRLDPELLMSRLVGSLARDAAGGDRTRATARR